MKVNPWLGDLTSQDYEDFRLIMIEDALDILSNPKNYINSDYFNPSSKIVHLDDLSDFFFLEDEFEITRDLNSLKKTIMVRHFLWDRIKDI